jgi:hypothetical protein
LRESGGQRRGGAYLPNKLSPANLLFLLSHGLSFQAKVRRVFVCRLKDVTALR